MILCVKYKRNFKSFEASFLPMSNFSSVALVSFSRYFLIVRDPKTYQLITLTFLFYIFFLLIRIMWVEVLQTFFRIESIHQKQMGISILNTVIVWLSKKSLRKALHTSSANNCFKGFICKVVTSAVFIAFHMKTIKHLQSLVFTMILTVIKCV